MNEDDEPLPLEIDASLIVTTVEPVFGRPFQVIGPYEPTKRELIFGRKNDERN